ncbi:MAG: PKD domain-containing protein, partial [Bacteroidia bacterium]
PAGYTSSVQNPVINVAASSNAGVYTLTVTDANSCTNTITTNVVINSTPTISVNNPTVCLNQTINLTATGGTGYAWAGPGGYTSLSQNPVIPNSTLPMTGQYTVLVTSATGCTNTAVANVSVFPLPNPAITSNTPCLGTTLSLNGSGGSVYAWTGPNSFSSNAQNPSITTVSALAGGLYTLVATVGTCSASTTGSITVNPLPTPNIVSNSPVCIGNPINFTGSGGVAYAWSGPGGYTDASQNPVIAASALSNTGNYTLTVTDANGCVNTIVKPVTVNPQPIVAAVGNTVCENSNASLSASGGVSYAWSGPGGFTSAVQNPFIAGTTMASAGQYVVVVTDVNTCTNTAVANLIINPAPTPSIVTNSPICINNVLSLAASGGLSYAWTGPNGFISAAQNPTIMANSLSVGGIYSVTATDSKGCTATIGSTTVINPNPVPFIVSSPNKGCLPLCVTYTCQVSAGSVINWNLGNGTTASNVNAATCYYTTGTYSITTSVTDANGCPGSATYTAQVYPNPVADYNYSPYKPIVNQDDVTFTDASYGANITGWNWYFMDNAQYTSTLQNPVFTYPEAGTYAVALVVKSDKGCSDTVVKSLVVGEDFGIWVPNAFTPNGDGLNDVFYAKGFGITKFEMQIFDRWGEVVFSSEDINSAWDGKFQGRGDKICAEDAYTWRVKVVSVFGKAKELTGHVTLIK